MIRLKLLRTGEFKQHYVLILRELAADSQLSTRKLSSELGQTTTTDSFHVRISDSIRKMRSDGLFREAILPNEAYVTFALFEFEVAPAIFEDTWRGAMTTDRRAIKSAFPFSLSASTSGNP